MRSRRPVPADPTPGHASRTASGAHSTARCPPRARARLAPRGEHGGRGGGRGGARRRGEDERHRPCPACATAASSKPAGLGGRPGRREVRPEGGRQHARRWRARPAAEGGAAASRTASSARAVPPASSVVDGPRPGRAEPPGGFVALPRDRPDEPVERDQDCRPVSDAGRPPRRPPRPGRPARPAAPARSGRARRRRSAPRPPAAPARVGNVAQQAPSASGRGRSFSVASTMMPSVPSEPM